MFVNPHQLHEHLFRGMQFLRLWPRTPAPADAYSLSLEEVVRRACEAWNVAPRKSVFRAGCRATSTDFSTAIFFAAIKHAIPQMHVHAFFRWRSIRRDENGDAPPRLSAK